MCIRDSRYPAFGNLVPRDVASRAAKERCDKGYGVNNTGLADVYKRQDRFKGLGEISPDEFKHFIGKDMRLEQVSLRKTDLVKELLEFYMGDVYKRQFMFYVPFAEILLAR